MSDRDRVLRFLRERGDAGVTSFEMRRLGLTGNPSERVRELRERGYEVSAERVKVGDRWGSLYRLAGGGAPARDSGCPPSEPGMGASPSAGPLFEEPVVEGGGPVVPAVFDPWSEAA